jgi:hypothetical protein
VREISVGAVQLQRFESGGERAGGGLGERFHNVVDSLVIQRLGDWIGGAKRHGAGRDGLPSAGFQGNCGAVVNPWDIAACFSTGVSDLDAGHRALLLEERGDALEHRNVFVLVDSVIARADAAARFYGGGFHNHESGTADGAAAKVNQMPVRRESIDGGVLAHGGDGDAVAKGNFADR